LREGHIWGDDFAIYLAHAKNIVEGHSYADTGYIFNPAVAIYSPTNYPPVFPLLLAPLYSLFGMSLMPMKIEQVIFFVFTLLLVYIMWRRQLGSGYTLVLIVILGFNPVFWSAKETIVSDVPFLFFFYLFVVVVRWNPQRPNYIWLRALLIGTALYLNIGTRSVGVALVPGFLLYEAMQNKRIRRSTWIALTFCATAMIVQSHFVRAMPLSYLQQAHVITPTTIILNVLAYSRALAGFWIASLRNWFALCVLLFFALLTATGMVRQLRRGFDIIECLLVPYLALVLLWPYRGGIRYVFPLIPWIGFLAMTGLRELGHRCGTRYAFIVPLGLLLILGIPYSQAYGNLNFGPIGESSNSPEFNELCAKVRQMTKPDDVLIYYRARALSLYTGRRTSIYNSQGSDRELWRWSDEIGGRYLVTTDAFTSDGGFLTRVVSSHPERLEQIYQNRHFTLYRIRSLDDSPSSPARNRLPQQSPTS
jgi:4-amino-4-deoxy-L-arabinose transferase-like glycosyltransferase